MARARPANWGKRGLSFEKLERILPVLGLQLEHSVQPPPNVHLSRELRQQIHAMSELL